MSLQPVNQEQLQGVFQGLLAFLSDESVSVPASMVELIFSAKNISRGIVDGGLIVCQHAEPAPRKEDLRKPGDGNDKPADDGAPE